MRDVRYKRLPAVGAASGSWTHSSLVEFLFAIPYLFTRVGKEPVPPRHILNDLFLLGIVDAGMSGGCEWKPFEITQAEYDELVEELCTMPTRNFVRDEELEKCRSLKQWRNMVLAKYHSRNSRAN